jgi:serine kinase of HPr protein (carbohydrate metabolism regulator)
MLLHATCVAIDNHGILLTGPSGIGKSDLALRLIDQGAMLVADDQVIISHDGDQVVAQCPETTVGLLEVRHVGLLRLPFLPKIPLALQIDLVTLDTPLARLPEPQIIFHLDRPLRCLRLPAMAASTPAKIRAALRYSDVTDDL